MVASKLGIYYTFKIVGEGDEQKIHALKWEEFSDIPLVTYIIGQSPSGKAGDCSCPAWTRECKHVKCVNEALADGKAREFHHWKWTEKRGWEHIDDIRSIEEFDIG